MTYNLRPTTINKFNIQLLVILVVSYWLLVISRVNAQTTPEILVSWRAINYVPADYQGKILPSNSSRMEAGFDLIDKNKISNLSQSNISWFLGGNLLNSKIGLKNINFDIANSLNQTMRITISGYKENDLDYIFPIPVTNPEIVIDAKTSIKTLKNQKYLPLKSYTFEARPFFFNVSNLKELGLRWRLNDRLIEGQAENSEFLKLNLESEGTPKETEISLSIGANNLFNKLELASKVLNFIVK